MPNKIIIISRCDICPHIVFSEGCHPYCSITYHLFEWKKSDINIPDDCPLSDASLYIKKVGNDDKTITH